jgi:hypothetical protein
MSITLGYRTVNTKIATKKIPRVFMFISIVKMSLCVIMYEAPNGDMEDETTKHF